MSSPYVAVVGPGREATAVDIGAARETGRLLAAGGAVVLTGGLGGVMAAALEGAAAAGGRTVALLPGAARAEAGFAATVVLATGLGEARNALLVRASDAVVAVGGSWGSLSEIALARRSGRPVVALGGWRVHDASGGEVDLPAASTPAEAVARVLEVLADPSGTMEK